MKKTGLILALFAAAMAVQAQTGREIMEKCDAANKADTSRALVEMTLMDKDGSSSSRQVEQIMLDEAGDSYSLIIFHAPANVKNTRFLSISHDSGNTAKKDQWIYLPALKKVRRIASGESDSSFMGTDFTYEDIGGRDLDESTYTNAGEEKYGEYTCWKIESTPTDSGNSQYAKILSWIDRNSLLIVKQQFYNGSGELIKTLETEKTAQVQGIWTRLIFKMTTHKSGHSTVLEVKKLVYNSDISKRVFTTNFLETGRL